MQTNNTEYSEWNMFLVRFLNFDPKECAIYNNAVDINMNMNAWTRSSLAGSNY